MQGGEDEPLGSEHSQYGHQQGGANKSEIKLEPPEDDDIFEGSSSGSSVATAVIMRVSSLY